MSASGGSGFHPCDPLASSFTTLLPILGSSGVCLGLLAFSLMPFAFVTLTFFYVTFVLLVTTFTTITTGDGTPEMVLMGHCCLILSVLLSFQLQHTTTAVVAVKGMTRSSLIIDRLTVEQRGHGTQVTLTFTTTVVGVSGINRPFPFATFRGRGATSTEVFREKYLQMGVILPLKSQLDQQVHKVAVRVGLTLPLRGSAAIVLRTCRNPTHEPQVGFCGRKGTHVHS